VGGYASGRRGLVVLMVRRLTTFGISSVTNWRERNRKTSYAAPSRQPKPATDKLSDQSPEQNLMRFGGTKIDESQGAAVRRREAKRAMRGTPL